MAETTREFKAYLVTNTVNGRRYVGITRNSVHQRWQEHVQVARRGQKFGLLYRAIRKYGVEAFTVEHIASADTWDAIVDAERTLIDQHRSLKPDGYNVIRGVPKDRHDAPRCFTVERKPWSEEHKRRISEKLRGRYISPETVQKRLATRARNKELGLLRSRRGETRSLEFRIKCSARRGDTSGAMYAGKHYATVALAAEAAGVSDGRTFRRWMEIFEGNVPELSEHERHALRFAHGRDDSRSHNARAA